MLDHEGSVKLTSANCAPRPQKWQAKATNDANFGVNKNTSDGRRYRDIVAGLIVEFGDSDPDRIREIAQLRVILERERLLCVNDPDRSSEDTIRLTNSVEKLEHRLRARISARRNGAAPGAPGAAGLPEFMGTRARG